MGPGERLRGTRKRNDLKKLVRKDWFAECMKKGGENSTHSHGSA